MVRMLFPVLLANEKSKNFTQNYHNLRNIRLYLDLFSCTEISGSQCQVFWIIQDRLPTLTNPQCNISLILDHSTCHKPNKSKMRSCDELLQPFFAAQGFVVLDGGLATELERRGADLKGANGLILDYDLYIMNHRKVNLCDSAHIVISSLQITCGQPNY